MFFSRICALANSLVVCSIFSGLIQSAQRPEDQGQGPALSPKDSLSKFHLADGYSIETILSEPQISQPLSTVHDASGRLWVVQYLQYPEPAGLRRLSRDNFWRTVYDSVPLPPGQGGVRGADKITIHEDRDGNGSLETETVFVDGLNIATAVVPTGDGAWVLNPPYLLYYSDKDRDLKADGPPEVHLEGFGLEDTHSVVNSLCMGPDGWLYAAQGSTVSGNVRRFGSSEAAKRSMGQAIWRYHPTTHQYEIFAEGGGNAFSVAFDDHGEIFSGHNGGDTRGFHYLQEAYYRKGFNKHGGLSNPNSFGYLDPMKHPPIQRFTHAMLMAEGTAFQASMPRSMLAVDPLHGKLIQTQLTAVGSTFETRDVEDILSSDDKWFRPVAIQDSPDGTAYVCDWYDFQVAHLYAHVGKMDREHGRIYRLFPTNSVSAPVWRPTLATSTDRSSLKPLFECLGHPYRWQRWKARELIAKHPHRNELFDAVERGIREDSPLGLESLWTAHACGWLEDTIPYAGGKSIPLNSLFANSNPAVRAWAVRLVCDDRMVQSDTAAWITSLAFSETHVKVLCQIASSAKRLRSEVALPIVSALLSRELPESDLSLPIMLWWAIEPHSVDPGLVLSKVERGDRFWNSEVGLSRILPNLIEVWAKANTPSSTIAISQLLKEIKEQPKGIRDRAAQQAMAAMDRALVGRSWQSVSKSVVEELIALGQPSLPLRLRQSDSAAIDEAMAVLADPKQAFAIRIQTAQIVGEIRCTRALPSLIRVATDVQEREPMREAALSALAAFDTEEIPETLIRVWADLTPKLRAVAGAVIGTRAPWAFAWLSACANKRVDPTSMPMECVRSMRLHNDAALQKVMIEIYPGLQGPDLVQAQRTVNEILDRVASLEGDPYRGKKQFNSDCARCHKLYAEGGEIGPDLTGYQRDQLQTLLRNIVAPSLEIREGYQTVGVRMSDGTVLTGFVENQTDDQIVIKGVDGRSHAMDRSEIEQVLQQASSIMPEGMLNGLTDQQIADLLAYLRSSQPLSDG